MVASAVEREKEQQERPKNNQIGLLWVSYELEFSPPARVNDFETGAHDI